jgi:hypothetical protein
VLNPNKKWIRRALCLAGLHEWKRAVRMLGNDGTQTCKHCPATRRVKMRPRATLSASRSV